MSRKDKPYLPLYVQDFLTDEKLMECSASATGVYIRIMCILHKCEPYGKLLLKQKDKQNSKQINNFALKLARYLPYTNDVILDGLTELVSEGCLTISEDYLLQKRMANDGKLSAVRALSGSEGGKKTLGINNFAQAKTEAKCIANTDIENENVIDNEEVKIFTIENCLEISLKDDRWVKANKTNQRELLEFNKLLEKRGVYVRNALEYKNHFSNWKKNEFKNPVLSIESAKIARDIENEKNEKY